MIEGAGRKVNINVYEFNGRDVLPDKNYRKHIYTVAT
jgi:hypothetical protein